MISVTVCPVCGNDDFIPFLVCTDYTVSQEKFSLQKCSTCKLVITSPRPANQALGDYYQSDDYISHTAKANNLLNSLYLLIRTFTLRGKKKLVVELQPSKGNLLDVGCGTGDFLQTCQNDGWQVVGMEPSKEPRALTQKKGIDTFETLESVKGEFQLITLWHVLEHVIDLEATLKKLHSLLAPNGVLLIAVPNHSSLDGIKYKEQWAGFDVPRHLWHFNKKNMEQLLQNHSFSLKKIVPMHFDSFYVSLLSEGYRGKRFLRYPLAFLTGFRSNLAAKKNNEFSSLIYIAQK